ncbi:uncharacterized protein LOC114131037 [Aphis gossypii]|uniref:C2H2-type domain-containing protein n=1 Tax=Aphis gossypii TaxID=80765 RepID=A0A9P0J766_APHGO|nr:uncharacterized protein LOC114131037 [Aphis gossypii]CAH1731686.1 unnamed protein product [Aphis gossypii]
MDPINSDVIVISDDDDAVKREFKDEDNLGDEDNHLMPKKKKKYNHYIKTEIDVFKDYEWTSIIEVSLDNRRLPENSIITQKSKIIKNFHCHYCVKCFPEEDLLKEHLKTHKKLQNTNKNTICKLCGKLICSSFKLNSQAFRKTCNCEAISLG